MSSEASPPRTPLLNRLPRERRDQLIVAGRQLRGIFGRVRFQRVFDEHLPLFEWLAAAGATAAMIGELLAEVGIAREDGTPLPPGTVSSGLSRARERAPRLSPAPLRAPATAGIGVQPRAATGRAVQSPAATGMSLQATASRQPGSSFDPPRARQRCDNPLRPSPNRPAGPDLSTETRDAVARLEALRSENDGESS
jgi:hypothetical protein